MLELAGRAVLAKPLLRVEGQQLLARELDVGGRAVLVREVVDRLHEGRAHALASARSVDRQDLELPVLLAERPPHRRERLALHRLLEGGEARLGGGGVEGLRVLRRRGAAHLTAADMAEHAQLIVRAGVDHLARRVRDGDAGELPEAEADEVVEVGLPTGSSRKRARGIAAKDPGLHRLARSGFVQSAACISHTAHVHSLRLVLTRQDGDRQVELRWRQISIA
eukprot:scaffold32260_cov70-Phaeocystis_antarctica.AAC.2